MKEKHHMVTVEMYGFHGDASIVRFRIQKKFQFKPYRDFYTVVRLPSVVTNHNEIEKPFIRIAISKDNQHIDDIIETLKSLHVDIQVMYVDRFISYDSKNGFKEGPHR